jgi:hypothetical protein
MAHAKKISFSGNIFMGVMFIFREFKPKSKSNPSARTTMSSEYIGEHENQKDLKTKKKELNLVSSS